MSLQKNEIPILEYDDSQRAVIMPDRKGLYAFPPKAVFHFLAEFGQILFTADTLANVEAHDDRNWGLQSFPLVLKLCFEAVLEMPSL